MKISQLNNRGLTLIEMLIALVLMGIVAQAFGTMMNQSSRLLKKMKVQQEEIAAMQRANNGLVSIGETLTNVDGRPLICLTGGQAFPCSEAHGCAFTEQGWKRQNQVCDNGILYIAEKK